MRWFIFHKGNILLTTDNQIPAGENCPLQLQPACSPQSLPDFEGEKACAIELPPDVSPQDVSLQAIPLRNSFYLLSEPAYRLAGKARELLYWDSTTRFCSVCGAPMERHTDISKRCTACGREVWPSISVAIIVLIRRTASSGRKEDEQALLVHARNFAGNYYGLIAGFLETGESLEECLQREVMEETGLRVKNVSYKASQPWPFPAVLMVGFFADYDEGELRLQEEELAYGGWFTRKELPPLPGRMSLARQLIERWLSEEGNPDYTPT